MARNFEAKNIIVGGATFYVGPAGVENTKINLNTSTSTAQDPTKVDIGTNASWYHLGYTQNGVTMNIEPTYGEVVVDQLLDVARLFKSSQRVTVATSLTETTLENLYVAIGGKAGGRGKGDFTASQSFLTDANQFPLAQADGSSSVIALSSSLHFSASTNVSENDHAGIAAAVLDINGGALGYAPVERSVCFVGPGPQKLDTTKNVERIYIGYRAVSMEAVGVAVQRDNATMFPVNFRLMPSEANPAQDGNATYGKIVDRVY